MFKGRRLWNSILSMLISMSMVIGSLAGTGISAYAAGTTEDPTAYDLWVGGVQFTSDNLVIDSDDDNAFRGEAIYDPEENTLTLHDFSNGGKVKKDIRSYWGIAAFSENDNELCLILKGDNYITVDPSTCGDVPDRIDIGGIYCSSSTDLRIKGENGKIDIDTDSSYRASYSYGILANGGLTVDSGSIEASAGVSDYAVGIDVGGNGLHINGGDINIFADESESNANNGIELEDTINAEANEIKGGRVRIHVEGANSCNGILDNTNSTLVIDGTADVSVISECTESGTSFGIRENHGDIKIKGGRLVVSASGNVYGSQGIVCYGSIEITDGILIASGSSQAIFCNTFTNSIPGKCWWDYDSNNGYTDESSIVVNSSILLFFGAKKVQFPAHLHSFNISGYEDEITATCQADGCSNPPASTTLTIVAPEKTNVTDEKSPCATLENVEGFNFMTGYEFEAGEDKIEYFVYNTETSSAGEQLYEVPTEPGTYVAQISLSAPVDRHAVAQVRYTIAGEPSVGYPLWIGRTQFTTNNKIIRAALLMIPKRIRSHLTILIIQVTDISGATKMT